MSGLWLAIDTATDLASVAAGEPPTTRAAAQARGARRHAAEILGLVEATLGRLRLRPRDLDGIVVGDGPGSFTGLRIGWAAAKGLAQEAGLELVAVPSLMAAAGGGGARHSLGAAPIAACFDALRGQVFGALYAFHPDRVDTLVAPAVLTMAEFARVAPMRPALVVGDGAVRYADEVTVWSGRAPGSLDREGSSLGASMLLALLERPGAARRISDLGAAEPVYGRAAEAQVKWEARHGRPLPDPSR
ncbi:MAG: tRNA (adenosine(37)-N6)-threonylcarbamoyltransferase complex dimerization subunit type 1 TsaB [Gemmatimonadales bacterium]